MSCHLGVRSLSERLKKSDELSAATSSGIGSPAIPAAFVPSRSEFNRKALSIGLAIHEISQKIARLAKHPVVAPEDRAYFPEDGDVERHHTA